MAFSEVNRVVKKPPRRPDSAMARHRELVKMTSIAMVRMTGLAAGWPSKLTRSGTPMNPEFGNAAVIAPKAPSYTLKHLSRAAPRASKTITIADRP